MKSVVHRVRKMIEAELDFVSLYFTTLTMKQAKSYIGRYIQRENRERERDRGREGMREWIGGKEKGERIRERGGRGMEKERGCVKESEKGEKERAREREKGKERGKEEGREETEKEVRRERGIPVEKKRGEKVNISSNPHYSPLQINKQTDKQTLRPYLESLHL